MVEVEGRRGAGLRVGRARLSNLAQVARKKRIRAISTICRFAINPVSRAKQAMAANSTTSRRLMISLVISNQEREDALLPEQRRREVGRMVVKSRRAANGPVSLQQEKTRVKFCSKFAK
jgi:hypothetical protein